MHSVISIIICRGSFGDVNDENSFYHVEPLSTEDKTVKN